MDADTIIALVGLLVPVAIGIMIKLGLHKKAADLVRFLAGKLKAFVRATPNPLDDMAAAPVLSLAESLAKDLEDGKIAGQPAADKAKELAEAIAKELAKKK